MVRARQRPRGNAGAGAGWAEGAGVVCLDGPPSSALGWGPCRACAVPCHNIIDEALAEKYNTEACEQAFAWLDRFCPFLLEMGPGMFMAHVTMMMDRRNALVVSKRKQPASEDANVFDGESLREASRARFVQLRQREAAVERLWIGARDRNS